MNFFTRRTAMRAAAFGILAVASPLALAQEAATAPDEAAIAFATGDRVLGDADAPVTIVEYASFSCPHCRDFHSGVFPEIKKNYIDTGKAKLIYREVYFDGPGLLAGSLARCVEEDKYFPLVSALYAGVETWLLNAKTLEDVTLGLSKLGLVAGLNKEQIGVCLDNRDLQNIMIDNSRAALDRDKVTGTPTLIVDGEKVENWGYENLSAAIDAVVPADFVAKEVVLDAPVEAAPADTEAAASADAEPAASN